MTIALSIFAALLLLSLLVMVHELGHYLAGRALGFSILEFSIGMGPKLLKKSKNGTEFSIRAFPIGGLCRFEGEDQEANSERSFNAQKVWKRIIVVISGPVMNLLFAIVCSLITLLAFGDFMPGINEVTPDSPAAVAGVAVGDVIEKVNEKPVRFYFQTVDMIRAVKTADMTLTVNRNGEHKQLTLSNIYNEELGRNLIGVTISQVRVRFGFGASITRSVNYVTATLVETFRFFGRAAQGDVTGSDAAGPVAIVAIISEAVRSGGEYVMRLLVLISASLGIMNLLPIPAMDGGRLAFMIVEVIRGKPIAPEKEGMVHFIGLILLFGLMILLTYNDITNLIRGQLG
ncbi:MAG: site-2 protease family protein [Eubacteriales bacterium]|nr:site-2 protease family protein [Eubacteriales bacterium]